MQPFQRKIRVNISAQRLDVLGAAGEEAGGERILASFPVSTSGYGLGSEPGSLKTPLGRFSVGEMIGGGAPPGMVFKSRLPTGEIAPFESPEAPDDLVLTRILWLEGLDPGNANTRERYIYIHGTNHEERIGERCSHGCIRMRNRDVVALFALAKPGMAVSIREADV